MNGRRGAVHIHLGPDTAGRARLAYEQGGQIFQYDFDVVNHEAIIVAMVGSKQTKKTNDPVAILNSVCHEGWELVNGSFVFIEEGSQRSGSRVCR